MIKILDQYLFKVFVKYYFFSLLIFTALFLIIDVVTTLNRFQVPGHVFLGYYVHYTPWIIAQMMPIAGVLATVFLFVSLQRHNELVVFYSLGVSIYRVLAPLLIFLFVISILGWVVTDKVVPKSMEKRNYYYYVEMKKNPGSYNKLKKSDIWFRTPEAIVNFKKVLSKTKVLKVKVFFYSKDEWKPLRIIEAESAKLNEDIWIFKDGIDTIYEGGKVTSTKFGEVTTPPLEDLTEFKKRQSRVESMSLSELSYAIDKGRESSMSTKLLETEYHGKLSFIFSALFLSLLALPFCIGSPRSSNVFVGLGFTLVLVMAYWVVYSICLNMGRTGLVPAMIAAWIPGFVSVAAFSFLMKKQRY